MGLRRRILGVQAIGEDGVEKRIDVIAMAIQKHGTVYDFRRGRNVLRSSVWYS